MPVTQAQAEMLTALAIDCRPLGSRKWDPAGTLANIKKIASWNLPVAIEHVIRHASDAKAETPGVIAKNFTPPAIKTPAAINGGMPPKKADECPDHVGQYPPPHCAIHAQEPVKAYWDEPVDRVPEATARDVARKAAAQAAANLKARSR